MSRSGCEECGTTRVKLYYIENLNLCADCREDVITKDK